MEKQEFMEAILEKLVSFQTVTGDSQSAHEALDYVADFVGKRGMYVERFESNGFESLIATTSPGHKTPTVMLGAHIDVVPAAEELFELRKADGKYYARGVYDMKFALAAYLQLIDELQEDLTSYDLGLMVTSDEESGGNNGVAKLAAEGYLPKVCILPDGGPDWQIQTFAKGMLVVRLVTQGKTAHGSRPWQGDNPILPLMNTVQEIQNLFDNKDHWDKTLSVNQFHAGEVTSQVPASAEACLDIRYITATQRDTLLTQIEQICRRNGTEVKSLLDANITKFSLDDPYISPFAKLINKVTGTKVTGSKTLGTSDARFLAAHGVPCISMYPPGGGLHSTEEWLSVEGFYQFKEILQQYVEEIAKTELKLLEETPLRPRSRSTSKSVKVHPKELLTDPA